MAHEYHDRRRIEFADTDMAGIVHFANYFRYMEMAEHAFLRSLGLSVHQQAGDHAVGWPRIDAECSFKSAATFEDELEIHLLVREKTAKTIGYAFRIRNGEGRPVAEGSITVICVRFDPDTKQMAAITIPADIDSAIDVAPAELLAGRPPGDGT